MVEKTDEIEDETISPHEPAEEETPEDTEVEEPSEDIDYTAELEKVKTQLGKAEHRIVELKKDKKKVEEDDDFDEPVSKNELRDIIREEMQPLKKDMNRNRAQEQAQSVSQNTAERELIMFHYENSIVLTGNVEVDIENAQALANRGRMKKQLSEAHRALRSNAMKGKGAESGQKKDPVALEPKLSPENTKLLRIANAKWDASKKGWVYPSGKIIKPEEL